MPKFFILLILVLVSCNSVDPDLKGVNFREEMRTFVGEISQYAKAKNPKFLIIPQNGIELASLNGNASGEPASMYLSQIDGVGQEDLFYGYDEDNVKTKSDDSAYLLAFLNVIKKSGDVVLVTDYCSDPSKMDDAFLLNNQHQFISFAAPDRELRVIPAYPPSPRNSNNLDIASIQDASNFLYLINPEDYPSKQAMISALAATNYDMIIIDAFLGDQIWTADEIAQLKIKQTGANRLVISYLSIGEAEDYRYYWQTEFNSNPPSWLSDENKDWPGNYKVKYWQSGWKSIVYGSNDSYLDRLLNAGFDGAYLDIIDGYEYFEGLL